MALKMVEPPMGSEAEAGLSAGLGAVPGARGNLGRMNGPMS